MGLFRSPYLLATHHLWTWHFKLTARMPVPAAKVFCGAARSGGINPNLYIALNTGTENDYSPGPYNITLSSGDVRVSFNISIEDDIILETSEEFLLSIDPSSLPDGVTVGSESNATVIIVDNNGECQSQISV